ncbi:MAG: hypothetical protein SLRJCFUN_001568 [Candidatus Fervidibacter sp.]|jgi:hypothetical protein
MKQYHFAPRWSFPHWGEPKRLTMPCGEEVECLIDIRVGWLSKHFLIQVRAEHLMTCPQCAQVPMTKEEAEAWLYHHEFIPLGRANIGDCDHEFFYRPIKGEKGVYELAVMDGWLNNWRPRLRKVTFDEFTRLRERIEAEKVSVWKR